MSGSMMLALQVTSAMMRGVTAQQLINKTNGLNQCNCSRNIVNCKKQLESRAAVTCLFPK